MKNELIHDTAIVDAKARIGKNVEIGPYTIIGPEVVIGDNTKIDSHITIKGDTTIGTGNSIGPYTSIGLSAQDRAHRDEPTRVVIGDNNEIREYVSINRGTLGGTGVTVIGNDNQIMINSHFGHDASVGDHCMIANATTLAGHVQMGSHVVTGGMSGFHQFCRIGDYSMLGGYSVAYQDIAPYMISTGHRAQILDLNRVGLERNGFSVDDITRIQQIFEIFFNSGLVPKKAVEILKNEIPAGQVLDRFVNFVESTNRGLVMKS